MIAPKVEETREGLQITYHSTVLLLFISAGCFMASVFIFWYAYFERGNPDEAFTYAPLFLIVALVTLFIFYRTTVVIRPDGSVSIAITRGIIPRTYSVTPGQSFYLELQRRRRLLKRSGSRAFVVLVLKDKEGTVRHAIFQDYTVDVSLLPEKGEYSSPPETEHADLARIFTYLGLPVHVVDRDFSYIPPEKVHLDSFPKSGFLSKKRSGAGKFVLKDSTAGRVLIGVGIFSGLAFFFAVLFLTLDVSLDLMNFGLVVLYVLVVLAILTRAVRRRIMIFDRGLDTVRLEEKSLFGKKDARQIKLSSIVRIDRWRHDRLIGSGRYSRYIPFDTFLLKTTDGEEVFLASVRAKVKYMFGLPLWGSKKHGVHPTVEDLAESLSIPIEEKN